MLIMIGQLASVCILLQSNHYNVLKYTMAKHNGFNKYFLSWLYLSFQMRLNTVLVMVHINIFCACS